MRLSQKDLQFILFGKKWNYQSWFNYTVPLSVCVTKMWGPYASQLSIAFIRRKQGQSIWPSNVGQSTKTWWTAWRQRSCRSIHVTQIKRPWVLSRLCILKLSWPKPQLDYMITMVGKQELLTSTNLQVIWGWKLLWWYWKHQAMTTTLSCHQR